MPNSGKEETGVIAWQSSNCSAGVPIKKRKFPLVRPPSPPPQEPPCLSLVVNKSSSPSQESSPSNASVGTSSLGKSNASKNSLLEIEKEISADTNVSLVGFSVDLSSGKPQAPIPSILSESLDTVDRKEMPFVAAHQNMTGITKLDLAPNEASPVQVTRKVPSKLQVGRDCTPELFGTNIELSLGPREPLVPALMAGPSSNGSSQIPDIFDPSSLCLSSSQDKSVGRCKGGDFKVNSASTHVHPNRSNWDLNTSMDAWEEPVGVGDGPEIVGVSGFKMSGCIHGTEPLISSTAVLGVVSDAKEQFIGAADRISNFSMSSLPPSGECRSEDSLHLSLSTSAQPNFSGEHSTSSAKVDLGTVLPNSKMVEGLVSTGNTSSVGCDTVKSEPFVANARHDCPGARGNPIGLSDLVNRGLVERCSIKAVSSPNVSPEKVFETISIKSEPVQENNEEKQVISHTSIEKVALCQENVSSSLVMALEPKKSCPSDFLSCSELSTGGDASNLLKYSDTDTIQGSCKMVDQAAAEMDFASLEHEIKESNTSEGMIRSGGPEDANGDDPERCTLEAMKSCPSDFLSCSELSMGGDASNQLKYSTYREEVPIDTDTIQGSCKMVDQAAAEMDFASLEHEIKESNTSEGMIRSGVPEDANGDDPERCTLEAMKSCPSDFLSCSEFSTGGDASNQLKYSTYREEVPIDTDTIQGSCKIVDQAAAEMDFASLDHEIKESNTSEGMIRSGGPEDANGDDPERCTLEAMDYGPLNSCRNSESSESEEENINILAGILEEDPNGFEYVSDGNHDVVTHKNSKGRHDGREDEYEDGEVREAQVPLAAEVPVEEREEEKIIRADCEDKISEAADFPGYGSTARAPTENDCKVEDHGEISDDHIEECVDAVLHKEADQVIDRDCSLQESSTVEEAAPGADEKSPIKTTQIIQPDLSGRNDIQKDHDMEEISDGATNGGQGIETVISQITNVNIKGTDTTKKVDPTLPKIESFANDKDAAKDANTGGSRSRIINLSRASNATSPCKLRFIPNRPLLSTTGRERYADFEGEKVHLRRNRGEFYADGPQRFDRDRFQDQPFRISRINFVNGRGRSFRQHGEWDSDRNFGEEIYNGPGDFRFPRRKRGSAGGDAEREGNSYGIAPNRALGMGRGERKQMSDELRAFRHPSSRKLSPGGRDGTGTRSNQLVRSNLGNGSPSRCTGEHDSNLVGLRHGEKFTRGLPEDVNDTMFIRSQRTNEGLDGFSTVQRRGLPRIRSKSPERSRTRSPGPWSSPRKRSPDGFSGLPELSHHRSQTIYRMERIKSHNRPCYTEEIVARRCGSPSYGARPSNVLTNMDSGRIGQVRSANPNRRRPFDRVLPRSTRRFDIIDPRERTDNDEYVRGPIRSGRFNELGGDGRDDERRKCGDRRGLVCSFRPPFNGADGENLRFHPDDGPGSSRICPEADSEFIERRNLREREFDRRIKNKPGIASSRVRSMEEEEGNYRHGGQLWQDDGFDDVSQMKRRRF